MHSRGHFFPGESVEPRRTCAVTFLHCTPKASDFLRFSPRLEPEHGCFGSVPRRIYLTVAGSQEASGFNVRFSGFGVHGLGRAKTSPEPQRQGPEPGFECQVLQVTFWDFKRALEMMAPLSYFLEFLESLEHQFGRNSRGSLAEALQPFDYLSTQSLH